MARSIQCILEELKEAADKAANLEILNARVAQDLREVAGELVGSKVDLGFAIKIYTAALKLERGV